MNTHRDAAEQMVAVRAQLLRPQWPVCLANATPEPVNTDQPPSNAARPARPLWPRLFVSHDYRHHKSPHRDVTLEQISNIFTAWVVFSPFRLYQQACQLLPPQSFINTVSLFIQRGQGSATMTTSASDHRPPINTSDTCGGKKKRGGFLQMGDWHCLFTTCRMPHE